MNAKKDQDVALKKYEKVEDMINQITVEMKGLNRGRNVAFNISEKVVKIGKKIGSGSFGQVYKCTFKGNEYAVKKIPLAVDSTSVRLFQAEFKILMKVDHPRIVRLIGYYETIDEHSDEHNFILEFMIKGSLRSMLDKLKLRKEILPQGPLLLFFMDIVFGVKYLHSMNIIHRDLKPDNCLFDCNNRMKIADFGVSKRNSNQNPEFQTLCGTPLYMAPEVFLDEPYDKTVDIWSLGVMFYEMAMYEVPFKAVDRIKLLDTSLSFKLPSIECAKRAYSTQMQDLLVLMLQRDPKHRTDLKIICQMSAVKCMKWKNETEELSHKHMLKGSQPENRLLESIEEVFNNI